MTPDQLRQITDPAARQREAARAIEHYRALMAECSDIREQAVRDLYNLHGTWAKVGEAIGTSGQNAFKLATRSDPRAPRHPSVEPYVGPPPRR